MKYGHVTTMEEVKEAHKEAGYHWFDTDTMKHFGGIIASGLHLPGMLFISSEKHDGDRRYTVRKFLPETGGIETHSDYQQFKSRAEALEWAGLGTDIPGEFAELDEDDQAKAMYLVDVCGYEVEDALDAYEDVTRYADSNLAAVAEELVSEGIFGEVNGQLEAYIDFDKLGHDLGYDGYTEHNGDVFYHNN
jgi:hypothetical protein